MPAAGGHMAQPAGTVIRQGPTMNPGGPGISQAIGQRMPGLPPRNPEWTQDGYPGPLHGVKF